MFFTSSSVPPSVVTRLSRSVNFFTFTTSLLSIVMGFVYFLIRHDGSNNNYSLGQVELVKTVWCNSPRDRKEWQDTLGRGVHWFIVHHSPIHPSHGKILRHTVEARALREGSYHPSG